MTHKNIKRRKQATRQNSEERSLLKGVLSFLRKQDEEVIRLDLKNPFPIFLKIQPLPAPGLLLDLPKIPSQKPRCKAKKTERYSSTYKLFNSILVLPASFF